MCKFCERKEADTNVAEQSFINERIDVGEFGEIKFIVNLEASIEDKPLRDLSVAILGCGVELIRDAEINYCPMCGRNLKEN